MKKPRLILICLIVLFLTLNIGQGCTMSAFHAVSGSESSLETKVCVRPAGVSGSPRTIEEAVALINSLPAPVTVACFLESLERPLGVTLTNNKFSGQPALDNKNPRVFILNDTLVISVVPAGASQDIVEFSDLISDGASIKAELQFPVMPPISARAPYDRIAFGNGTSCRGCHNSETAVTKPGVGTVFTSGALQPSPPTLVDLGSLKNEAVTCDRASDPDRCEILDALFDHGEVKSRGFPIGTPYLF